MGWYLNTESGWYNTRVQLVAVWCYELSSVQYMCCVLLNSCPLRKTTRDMYEEMWNDQEECEEGDLPDMPDFDGLVPDIPMEDGDLTCLLGFLLE